MDLVGDLHVYRHWNDDPGLLSGVRGLFSYDAGEDRAGGYLYIQGAQDWSASFVERGAQLLADLQHLLGVRFTVVVFQAYRDGSGCTWHADDGYDVQAVLSLGVTRTFGIRKPDAEPIWVSVEHGDLVVMPSGFQAGWQHCVPAEDVIGERCSLVFRAVKQN